MTRNDLIAGGTMTAKPFFIHSLFRGCSTYLFSKLQGACECTSFEEALHEFVLFPHQVIQADELSEKRRFLRHPTNTTPYFHFVDQTKPETFSLLRESAIYYDYFSDSTDDSNGLMAYFESLIAQSSARPLFKEVRTMARIDQMRRSLGGTHLSIIRHPWDQWRSLNTALYFSTAIRLFFFNSATKGLLAEFKQHLRIAGEVREDFSSTFNSVIALPVSASESYQLFYFLWCFSYSHASAYSDKLIQIETLRGTGEQKTLSDWFASQGFHEVDFSDFKLTPYHYSQKDLQFFRNAEQKVNEFFIKSGHAAWASFRRHQYPNPVFPQAASASEEALSQSIFEAIDSRASLSKYQESCIDRLEFENAALAKGNEELRKSLSWRLTAPLRHLFTYVQICLSVLGRKKPENLSAEIGSTINAGASPLGSASENQQPALSFHVEGPFDSSYSLAIVNREFAIALHRRGFDVTLHSTEGPGDFAPSKEFLENNELVRELYEKSLNPATSLSDITTRNMYPPRVDDYSGGWLSLHAYAWEESNFPAEWVSAFNEQVDFIACASTHTRRVLTNSGVNVPTVSLGHGIDHWDKQPLEPFELDSQKRFRFLHVSSGFPRKGTNLLIEAFLREFKADDDVSLVIKTFSNPHNTTEEFLAAAKEKFPCSPEVIVLQEDFSPGKLKALYEQCDVMVAPSFAEGFCLPIAEGMLSGLPAITTAWGGQLDFCCNRSAWLLDYNFEQTTSHFKLFHSVWAVPRPESLQSALRDAFACSKQVLQSKAMVGAKGLRENFTWDRVAREYATALFNTMQSSDRTPVNVGILTTWNTRCGIAQFTKHLAENLEVDALHIFAPYDQAIICPDEPHVARIWHTGKKHGHLHEVLSRLVESNINLLLIQFNNTFYRYAELSELVDACSSQEISVVIELHSSSDAQMDSVPPEELRLEFLKDAFSKADRLLVHSVHDLNRMKGLGLVDNVALMPLGIKHRIATPEGKLPPERPFKVATFGFCLPKKGLEELVHAAKLLIDRGHQINLRLINAEYPNQASSNLVRQLREQIESAGLLEIVDQNHQFLSEGQYMKELVATDLLVFGYQESAESASAAVRDGLSSGKAVLVTPLKIFEEFGDAVFRSNGTDPESLAESIAWIQTQMLQNTEAFQAVMNIAEAWRAQHDFKVIGKRISGMFNTLVDTRSG